MAKKKKKIIEDEDYNLYFKITTFYKVLHIAYDDTFYFMLEHRLFGGKQITYEHTHSAVFWEEEYTLPNHIDKNDWLQVVANRATTKHIYMEKNEFEKYVKWLW